MSKNGLCLEELRISVSALLNLNFGRRKEDRFLLVKDCTLMEDWVSVSGNGCCKMMLNILYTMRFTRTKGRLLFYM